ncbi:hypothetical protein EDC94DRAFT_510429, partial [Helicostylum pulchrum]
NKLTNKIDSLKLMRVVNLVVCDGLYHLDLIKQVLKYATSLSSITFEEKENFSIKFVQSFMKIERECVFTVSKRHIAEQSINY